jgi:hypothetical protein
MKKFTLIFALLLNFAFAKKYDLSAFKIDLNPKEEAEWRPSTVEKFVEFCIQAGAKKDVCECRIEVHKKNYKENEFLKIRAKIFEMLENGEDISKNQEVMKVIQSVNVCQSK